MNNMKIEKLAELAAALPVASCATLATLTDYLVTEISEAFVLAAKRVYLLQGEDPAEEATITEADGTSVVSWIKLLDDATLGDVQALAKDLSDAVMSTLSQEEDYDKYIQTVGVVVRFDDSILNLIEIMMMARLYDVFDITIDGQLLTSQLPIQASMDLTSVFALDVVKSEQFGSAAVGVLISARCLRLKTGQSLESWQRNVKKTLPSDLHKLYLGARVQLRTFTKCATYGVSLEPDEGEESSALNPVAGAISSQLFHYTCEEPEHVTDNSEEEEA